MYMFAKKQLKTLTTWTPGIDRPRCYGGDESHEVDVDGGEPHRPEGGGGGGGCGDADGGGW